MSESRRLVNAVKSTLLPRAHHYAWQPTCNGVQPRDPSDEQALYWRRVEASQRRWVAKEVHVGSPLRATMLGARILRSSNSSNFEVIKFWKSFVSVKPMGRPCADCRNVGDVDGEDSLVLCLLVSPLITQVENVSGCWDLRHAGSI